MAVGIEGLPVVVQRTDAAHAVQAGQLNVDRAQQLAAGARALDAGVRRDTVVEDRPNVELDGLWGDERRGEPWQEQHPGSSEDEAPPLATPPPSPDGRGARIDLQA